MSSIIYGMVKAELFCNQSRRLTYGIAAYANADGNCLLAVANDLSADPTPVQELVNRCNNGDLSLEHFHDILEDFMNDG